MKNEELIQALVLDLTPVHRLAKLGVRTWLWIGFALACVGAETLALGTRGDLATRLRAPAYLAEAAALLALFGLSAWNAFRASIPGIAERARSRFAALFALLAWFVLIAHRYVASADSLAEASALSSGLGCAARMLGLALAPSVCLLFMLRRAAPLQLEWTGFCSLLSASALAMLGTQAVCAKDGAAHVLLWHFAPVLIAAGIGGRLGRLLLHRSPTAR